MPKLSLTLITEHLADVGIKNAFRFGKVVSVLFSIGGPYKLLRANAKMT